MSIHPSQFLFSVVDMTCHYFFKMILCFQGCILVKKKDIEVLQDLVKKMDSLARPYHSIDNILNSKSYMSTLRSENKDDLVSKFESVCGNSSLRSKIETVKSSCTNSLKTNLKG